MMSMSLAQTTNLSVLRPRASSRVARRSLVVRAQSDPIAPKESAVPDDVISYAKSLPGISQPFPQLFDPFNLLGNAAGTKDGVNEVKRWRESELTHGRVAMLAALGFIAQEQILGSAAPRLFPHVNGPAINHFQQVEKQGAVFWLPLLLVIAIAESYRVQIGWAPPSSGNFYKLNADYKPGTLGFDPLNLYPSDPKAQYDLETKEINNGRLAMIAIAAFVAQELRTQKPIFENLNLTGYRSPK